MSGVSTKRKTAALEERIVDQKCCHDWRPDAFGSALQVCFKCWSTRSAPQHSGDK